MEFSLMELCHPTRLLEEEMILSTPSSLKQEPENMFPGLFLWISSQLLLMRCGLVPTGSSSILSNSSLEKKMLQIIMPEGITPLARKLLTLCSTGSASLLTPALVFRASSSSTPLVVALDLGSPPFLWSVSLLTMGRDLSWSSPSTQHHKLLLPWLSLTTLSSQPIQLWNIQTV